MQAPFAEKSPIRRMLGCATGWLDDQCGGHTPSRSMNTGIQENAGIHGFYGAAGHGSCGTVASRPIKQTAMRSKSACAEGTRRQASHNQTLRKLMLVGDFATSKAADR
jgi:hypothetical protein